QLADHKQRFGKELAVAQQYGAKMAEQDQQFRFAADSLVKQDPGAQQALASRAAQMGTGDYVATAAANVRSGPNGSADRVASLTKGQRVHGMAEPASAGWRKIALEDGTAGYVTAKVLSPAGGSGSVPAPASAPKPPAAGSRNVQVAVAATETIPEKRVAYNRAIDDAAKQSNLSFNLDQTS
ncbi:MAG TPA: SH3 domain-containing protein, partial [Stellaceae bacterium]